MFKVNACIMEIEKIVSDLVSFKSSHNNPREIEKCLDYCENFFETEIDSRKVFVEKYSVEGVKSIVLSNKEGKDFDVILLGHIDTVDGDDELFNAKIKDGKIYGRGTMDMKAFVATSLVTFQKVVNEQVDVKIALMIVSDEELGGIYGANYLVNEANYRAQVVLVPDDGEGINQIVSHSKNILSLKFSAKGTEAHGCVPWEGENSIEKNIETYQNLKKLFPETTDLKGEQWIDTINLGKISGGTASNEVPGFSEMEINIRWTEQTSKEQMLKKIESCLVPGVSYEVLMDAEGSFIDFENNYVKTYIDTIEEYTGEKVKFLKSGGGTDGRYFHYKNMPVILHQGSGGAPQGENEFVNIKSLYELVDIQFNFIKKISR